MPINPIEKASQLAGTSAWIWVRRSWHLLGEAFSDQLLLVDPEGWEVGEGLALADSPVAQRSS